VEALRSEMLEAQGKLGRKNDRSMERMERDYTHQIEQSQQDNNRKIAEAKREKDVINRQMGECLVRTNTLQR
jgi:hypothetical protein